MKTAKGHYKLLSLVIVVLLTLSVRHSWASHIMASDITYKSLGGDSYQITLTFYRDCAGISAPSSPSISVSSASCGFSTLVTLSLAPGSPVEVSAICNASIPNTRCNGGGLPGVQEYRYTGTYTLPSQCKDWVFSYGDCCRNGMITNLSSQGDFYLETKLDNTVFSGNNSSPIFTNVPTPYICINQPFTYNHGAIDPDGDSLVYSIVNSQQAAGAPIGFSSGYSINNPFLTGPGGFSFDVKTGSFYVIANQPQVCVISMQVKEYRGNRLIGTVIRELQAIVLSCVNNTPYVDKGEIKNLVGGMQIDSNSVEVCPGDNISFDILGLDADLGNIITVGTNIATSIPNATLVVTGTNPVSAVFNWSPTFADIGFNTFTFSIKDDGCPIVGAQTYVFDIRVTNGTSAGMNRYYCTLGGAIQLNAVGGTVFNWTALNGGPAIGLSCTNCSSPLASPPITTSYLVTSNFPTASGCSNKDTITVFVVPSFNVTSSPDTNLCSLNNGVPISVSAGPDPANKYTYAWSPSGSLSNSTIMNPIARPTVKTNYICLVTSQFGCTISDTVKVDTKGLVDMSLLPYDGFHTCNTVPLGVYLDPLDYAFYEGFDNEIDSTLWSSLVGGTFDDQCGSYDHEAYYLNQDGVREITTFPIDLSKGSAISFYLKTGNCKNCLCDYPENDDQIEDLVFEYSIDGGANWVLHQTFNSDVYALSSGSFTRISINLPASANTTTTQLRWRQLNHNIGGKDVWIIDEVKIKTGINPHSFSWTPTFAVNNPTIQFPIGAPVKSTMYHLVSQDLVTGCILEDSIYIIFDSVTVVKTPGTVYYCRSSVGSYAQLNAEPKANGNYTFSWTPSYALNNSFIPDPQATPVSDTTYVVTATDINGCVGRGKVNVIVNQNFNLLPTKDTALCDKNPFPFALAITPPKSYIYKWTPAAGLSDPAIYNPVITPSASTQYTVKATHKISGCVLHDTINVTVYPDYDLTVTNDTSLCMPNNTMTLSALTSPGSGYTYRWEPLLEFADPSLQIQTVNPTSDITYKAFVFNNCWKTDSVRVKVFPEIILNTLPDTSICESNKLLLNTTVGPPNKNYVYTWTPSKGLSADDILSPKVTGNTSTEYIITVKDKKSGCKESDTVNVIVYPDFKLKTSKDITLCPYDLSVDISAEVIPSGPNYSYFWSPAAMITNPGAPLQSVSPSSTTKFYISVHQANGCWKTDSVKVSVYQGIINVTASNDTTIYEGDAIDLIAKGANSYKWTPVLPGTDPTKNIYNVTPDSATTFMVVGKDACYTDTAYTRVKLSPVLFTLPNLITPNGDGKNDSFEVSNYGRDWTVEIYNRWSELVFKQSKYTNGWHGQNCSDGIYYYLLTNVNTGQTLKGWIEVVR